MRKIIALLMASGMLLTVFGCSMETAPGVTAEPSVYVVPTEAHSTTEAPPQEMEPPAPTQSPIAQPEPSADEFVPVLDYIPDLAVDLRYASENNFTGRIIYSFQDAYLRYGTLLKLMEAQQTLNEMGLGMKLWDAFRPVSAQYSLWQVCPDPGYVANPQKGYSSHSRGNTVDITLVDASGAELEMPTGFDDFTALADRDYSDCSQEAAANALLLQQVMEDAGFQGYYGEWWHYSDMESYPVEQVFTPLEPRWLYISSPEPVSLLVRPDPDSPELIQLSDGDGFLILAQHGAYYLIYIQGLRGYIPAEMTIQ